jgi:hypothetical protein
MNHSPRIQETLFMDKLRRLSKPIAHLVSFGMLVLSVHLPTAQATIVTTDAVVSSQQAVQDRAHVSDMLSRADVAQQLAAAGVDPSEVLARVDALSDQEVHALAQQMDEMPAAGSAGGVILFIFLVLLVTDLLGYTDVFPFVKKPVRR